MLLFNSFWLLYVYIKWILISLIFSSFPPIHDQDSQREFQHINPSMKFAVIMLRMFSFSFLFPQLALPWQFPPWNMSWRSETCHVPVVSKKKKKSRYEMSLWGFHMLSTDLAAESLLNFHHWNNPIKCYGCSQYTSENTGLLI